MHLEEHGESKKGSIHEDMKTTLPDPPQTLWTMIGWLGEEIRPRRVLHRLGVILSIKKPVRTNSSNDSVQTLRRAICKAGRLGSRGRAGSDVEILIGLVHVCT